MNSHIFTLDLSVMDEETLISLCMLIPGENLRRAVARCLWFDVVDELPDGVRMDRLKALADPERIDREMDWSEEEERLALSVVGYRDEQIDTRMRIHHEYRVREQRGSSPSEYRRILENGGERLVCNQWTYA
jgi:hypothetical protein